jgi:hypothetical protein
VDITYFYKDTNAKGRNGFYVFTVLSNSREIQFLRESDLVLVIGDKKFPVGHAERSAKNDGMMNQEMLKYRISRETLEKLMNNDEAYLKIGKEVIIFTGARYLVYNLLQIAN